jgi:hypothetical protein
MRSPKVILAAAAVAAMASPVMAQTYAHRGPPLSEPTYKDCVHITFPQCTSDRRTLTSRAEAMRQMRHRWYGSMR